MADDFLDVLAAECAALHGRLAAAYSTSIEKPGPSSAWALSSSSGEAPASTETHNAPPNSPPVIEVPVTDRGHGHRQTLEVPGMVPGKKTAKPKLAGVRTASQQSVHYADDESDATGYTPRSSLRQSPSGNDLGIINSASFVRFAPSDASAGGDAPPSPSPHVSGASTNRNDPSPSASPSPRYSTASTNSLERVSAYSLHQEWSTGVRSLSRRSTTTKKTVLTWLGVSPDAQMIQARQSQSQDSIKLNAMRFAHILNSIFSRLVVTPYTAKHVVWVGLSIVLLAYDIVVIPMEMFDPGETSFTAAMTWIIRMFWTTDLILAFFTGYIDAQGNVVKNPSLTALRYLKGHFIFDFSIVLVSWLDIMIDTRASGLIRNLKLFRFVRLLRLKKGREIYELMSDYIRTEKIQVIVSSTRILLLFGILIHFIACTWYGLSNLTRRHGLPNWVEIEHEDMQGAEGDLGLRYTYSFHFAISLFFGEHIAQPHNIVERIYVMFVLYCSFLGQIVLVSSITTAMTHLEICTARRSSMFFQLERFLTCHSISRELELKVQRNAKHAIEENERSTEEANVELLNVISEPLMMDLHREINRPIISVHPFFRCADRHNASCVRAICHRAVSTHKFARDDLVFTVDEKPSFAGSAAGATLFVISGELNYHTAVAESTNVSQISRVQEQEGNRFQVLRGAWVCEAVLWTPDWVHCGTFRASTDCRLLAVDAAKFREVMKAFHLAQVIDYARDFVDCLNQEQQQGPVTDLLGGYTSRLYERLGNVFEEEWAEVKGEYPLVAGNNSVREASGVFGGNSMSSMMKFRLSKEVEKGEGTRESHLSPGGTRESRASHSVLPSEGSQ